MNWADTTKIVLLSSRPTLLRSYIRNFLFIYKKYRSDWISLNDETTLVLNAVSLEYLSQTGNFFFYEMVHWGDCNFISYYHGRVNKVYRAGQDQKDQR